jgi:glycosyltransferase involved in cell wall biosynthesis
VKDIGIVIPTLNSSRTIAACLKSIQNQTFGYSEVLVVDCFSKDGTAAIARNLGASVIQMEANRSLARNVGLRSSSSTNVLFVDSDMILSRTVVEECLECLDHNDAVVIPEVSIGKGFWAQCKQAERGENLLEAARCFRKSALVSIGSYNSDLEIAEDLDLQNRAIEAGLTMGRIDATIFHDEGNINMISAMRKKYFYAKKFQNYLRTSPSAGFNRVNPVRGIVLPALRVSASSPRYGPGVLIMKSMEWAAALFGYISGRWPDRSSRSSLAESISEPEFETVFDPTC